MADTTNISWTDHTFNPWWGCTRIAPGCDNCYAAAFDARVGGDYWNPHVKPRRTRWENWSKVIKWHDQAKKENRRHRVFCGSMMDVFDKDAPEHGLDDLWDLIEQTPMLDWQLLTKRATRIENNLPYNWGDGYPNVWIGVTCENMEHGFPRIEALKNIPAKLKFISAEPLLGPLTGIDLTVIDWVIIGGESGPSARHMKAEWACDLMVDCLAAEVPFWFKQWGGSSRDKGGCLVAGKEWKEWPRGVE